MFCSPGALDFEMEKNYRKLFFFQGNCLKLPRWFSIIILAGLFCNSRRCPGAILDLWNSKILASVAQMVE